MSRWGGTLYPLSVSYRDAIRSQLMNNPHPPAEQSINREVRNLDAWYAAFDVKPGDKLYIAPAT